MSDPVFYAPNYVVTSADKDTDEALKLAAGTTILGLTYSNMAGSGVRAHGVQDITVISGATIRSQDNGIEFVATTGTVADPNRIFNSNGFIWALTGTAISFAGGESVVLNHGAIQGVTGIKLGGTGRLDVLNSGMITASEQAIVGGSGKDRVVNTGIIHATGASDDAVAISLGLDDDFYDGSGGAVIGKIDLGEGNDKAYGGAGSEWFLGGAGDDLFDGGAGIDTVEYQGATGGIKVDLNMTTRQWIGSGQGYDTLVNIENIIGSKNNDTLIGSNGDNRLEGGKGDDILEGGDGSDTLVGGEGNDTVRYTGSANVTVDLEITTLQQISAAHGSDLLLEIENVETGSGADEIIGNDADNRISSGSGNDTLTGGKGNDTLDGGSGTNTAKYSGAKSNYTITHNANGTVTVKDNRAGAVNEGTDTLRDIRFLKFSDATHALRNAAPKDISLSRSSVEEDMGTGETVASIRANDPDGDAITYSLVSNPGNLFSISGSSLILNGKLDFETAESHTIQILAKDAYGGEAVQTFTIKVSNVIETTPVTKIGTNAGEQVLGENGNDRVYGRKGNDQVFGRKGDDLLYGEDGNDYVIGGDSATGSGAVGTGNDTIYGGKGNDTIYGGDGNDVLHGNTGKDVLYGGTGKDTFVFDSKISSSNIDHIADFKPVDDTIKLSRSIFKKMPKGTLKKDSFVVGDYFKDGNDRILYHKKFGALFYDPDGSGPAKTVQFATIAKNLSLTHKDFIIF